MWWFEVEEQGPLIQVGVCNITPGGAQALMLTLTLLTLPFVGQDYLQLQIAVS